MLVEHFDGDTGNLRPAILVANAAAVRIGGDRVVLGFIRADESADFEVAAWIERPADEAIAAVVVEIHLGRHPVGIVSNGLVVGGHTELRTLGRVERELRKDHDTRASLTGQDTTRVRIHRRIGIQGIELAAHGIYVVGILPGVAARRAQLGPLPFIQGAQVEKRFDFLDVVAVRILLDSNARAQRSVAAGRCDTDQCLQVRDVAVDVGVRAAARSEVEIVVVLDAGLGLGLPIGVRRERAAERDGRRGEDCKGS